VAVATMLGGIAQLALVWWAIRRAGFVPRIRWPKVDAEVRRFWVLAVPAILAGGITQINIFVGTVIASGANEVMSIIYNADRLYQLPLGIIGIAIGTVLLPELSRHIGAGRDVEARASQSQSLFLSMLLSMPAAGALIGLALPIVRVLFERGAFGPEDSVNVSQALVAFAVGIPAFVLIRVLQPGFFSRKDTKTPTWFAAISLVRRLAPRASSPAGSRDIEPTHAEPDPDSRGTICAGGASGRQHEHASRRCAGRDSRAAHYPSRCRKSLVRGELRRFAPRTSGEARTAAFPFFG